MPCRSIILGACLVLASIHAQANTLYSYEKAYQLYQQGDYNTSIIHLRNLLQQSPDDLAAQLLFGRILLLQQQFPEALSVFEGALTDGADINLISDELSYLYLLSKQLQQLEGITRYGELRNDKRFNWLLVNASLLLQVKQTETAKQRLLEAEKLNPNSPELRNAFAEYAIATGNYSEASKTLLANLQQHPNHLQTLLLLGNLEFVQQSYARSLNYYQQGLALEPTNPLLLRGSSAAYFATGNLADALVALEKLGEMGLTDAYQRFALPLVQALINQTKIEQPVQELLSDLSALPAEYWRDNPEQLFLRAVLYYLNNSEELALKDFEEYLKHRPADLNAIIIVAEHYSRKQPPSVTLKFLDDKKAYFQDYPPLIAQHVLTNIRLGRVATALEMLQEKRARFPDNPELASLSAELIGRKEGPATALASLEQSALKESESTLLSKALFAKDSNQGEKALGYAKQLLELKPANLDYQNLYAGLLLAAGQLSEAEQVVASILAIQPDFFAGLITKVNLLKAQQQHQDANRLLLELLKRQPQNEILNVLKASVEFQLNEHTLAEDRLIKILNRQLYRPALMVLLQYYLNTNQADKALFQLRQALRRDFSALDLLLLEAELLINTAQQTAAVEKIHNIILRPDLPAPVLEKISQLQLQIALPEAAYKTLERAQKLSPDNSQYELELIDILLTVDPGKVAARLDRFKRAQGETADYFYLKAMLEEAQGEPAKAFTSYTRSVNLAPGFRRAWANLYELSRQAQFSDAFTKLTAIQLSSRAEDYWLTRLAAEHAINHQDWNTAIRLYQYLLERNQYQNDVLLHNNLANAFLFSDVAAALKHAEYASQLAKNEPLVLTTYAKALLANSQPESALAALRQAYAQRSSHTEVNLLLAESLVKLNRRPEAKPFLTMVIEQSNDAAERKKAQQLLAE